MRMPEGERRTAANESAGGAASVERTVLDKQLDTSKRSTVELVRSLSSEGRAIDALEMSLQARARTDPAERTDGEDQQARDDGLVLLLARHSSQYLLAVVLA